jgi:hypothetical protein
MFIVLGVAGSCGVGATLADGRWVYTYADDFSTFQAEQDSYDHSIFWPEGDPPPAEPYLFYTEDVQPAGALGFAGHEGWEAHLAYCFPLESGGPAWLQGALELDVYEWLPGGILAYELSFDGDIWTQPMTLTPGHHRLPLASDQGTCYVYFFGDGALIDNLAVRIIEAAEVLYVDDDAPNDPGPGDPQISDPLEDGSPAHPFDAIQEVIDLVQDGVEIVVADGTYTGEGNRNIDFCGKTLWLRSADGPSGCIIDCENDGRAFHFHNAEPNLAAVVGFTISGGGGVARGGGVCCEYAHPTIANCAILSNTTEASDEAACGGGVCLVGSNALLVNCVIAMNAALGGPEVPGRGGAVYCDQGHPTIANCTIALNSAAGGGGGAGGGIYCCEASPTVANCILWADSPQEIHVTSGSPSVSYSDVQGGWAGTGNINASPQFVGPDDPRLLPASPCIDAGDSTAVPYDYADVDRDGVVYERAPLDLAGAARFADDPLTSDTGLADPPDYPAVVDMGACEFERYRGDLDGDNDVDLNDLSVLLAHYGATGGVGYADGDVDEDGDVDLNDLSMLLAVYGATYP